MKEQIEKDLQEIQDICLKFCANRNPDQTTRETFKAIYEIAEKSEKNITRNKKLMNYVKLQDKLWRRLNPKQQKELVSDCEEELFTKKLDKY